MDLVFQFTLLIVGLALLWKMGELAVRNALGFSAIFGIHQFTVGFIIFAISTGLPEISATIVSSLTKVPELSVGALVGSTLVNMTLILGIITIFAKRIEIDPPLKKKLLKSMIMIIFTLLWIIFVRVNDLVTAILLILLYVGSIFWFQAGLPKEETTEEIKEIEHEMEKIEKKAMLSPKIDILIKLFGSLGLLLLSSWIIVHAATKVAEIMNINLTLLGGTVVAIGTSFPELALEIHAIKRKEYSLALGDLFGSSLLNISFILGLLMLMNSRIDLSFVGKLLPFIGAVIVWVVQAIIRKKAITKGDGFLFLAIFLCYIGWSFYSYFLPLIAT